MKKRGFTLIELIIVIAIIGILATIVMVNYISAQAKSRDSKRKADVESIATALEMYKSNHGDFVVGGGLNSGEPMSLANGSQSQAMLSNKLSAYLPNIGTLTDPKSDPENQNTCGSVYNYCIWIFDNPSNGVSTESQAYAVMDKMETSTYKNYGNCYKSSNFQYDPGITCTSL